MSKALVETPVQLLTQAELDREIDQLETTIHRWNLLYRPTLFIFASLAFIAACLYLLGIFIPPFMGYPVRMESLISISISCAKGAIASLLTCFASIIVRPPSLTAKEVRRSILQEERDRRNALEQEAAHEEHLQAQLAHHKGEAQKLIDTLEQRRVQRGLPPHR